MGDLLNAVSDDFAEIRFQILADDKNDLVKSSFQRIMDRIIHNDLAARSYRCQLLNTAAKPASNTSCHNY